MHYVHVLKTNFNQVRLQNLYITVGEGLDFEANVVVEGPFIFNIKLVSISVITWLLDTLLGEAKIPPTT